MSTLAFSERRFKAPDIDLSQYEETELFFTSEKVVEEPKNNLETKKELPKSGKPVSTQPSKKVIGWEKPNNEREQSLPLRTEERKSTPIQTQERVPMEMNTNCVNGQCDQNFSYPTRQRRGFFRRLFR